jgi:hypothetical protein
MKGRERIIELFCIVQIEYRRVWLFELPLFNRISFHFLFSNSRFLFKFLREHVILHRRIDREVQLLYQLINVHMPKTYNQRKSQNQKSNGKKNPPKINHNNKQ